MKHVKSERLKKLESELADLEQWLKFGLVPKKDTQKHKEEIEQTKEKIDEEKERLKFLKESGDMEDINAPKKTQARAATNMPDDEGSETMHEGSESNFETESSTHGYENTLSEKNEETKHDEDEESYFSDKNRWKRGGIVDPDADEW
ncbi:hypothetical protein N9Y92_04600 [Chlamydiales bacterium]|nr:hypothetical protein [Chlamydiales bacterium]